MAQMRYFKYNHDVFLPGQTFCSSRKLTSRSADYRQTSSAKRFKVGYNSIIITKLKKQPNSFNTVTVNKSIKDELMRAILRIQLTPKEETTNKINSFRLERTTERSDSMKQKTPHRRLMTLSDFRDNSLDVIPMILNKRPVSKQSIDFKTSRGISEAKQFKLGKQVIEMPKQLECQRKQNIEKRKKQLHDKKLAIKTIRFMGQQVSPW